MTKLFSNYKRAAIDFASAQGNYLTDTTGKTYLDFSSGIGVTNLGYHPRVNQALTDQVGKILHQPNLYYNQSKIPSTVEPSDPCLPLVRIKSNKVLVKACPTLAMPFLTTWTVLRL